MTRNLCSRCPARGGIAQLRSRTARLTFLAATALALLAPRGHAASKWADIDPADLAATQSRTTPDADAEILFSRHRLDSNGAAAWSDNHVQAKIYTERAVNNSSILRITFEKSHRLRDVAVRVVKPDATSVELRKDQIHETTLEKSRGREMKQCTFAIPNLQPGDVIEYRWQQDLSDQAFHYYQYRCEAPIPTREFSLEIDDARSDYEVRWFNCPNAEVDRKRNRIVVRNVPAFIEEPFMPAEKEFLAWILLVFKHPYFRYFKNEDSAWREIGKFAAEEFRLRSAPNRAIKDQAAQLVAGVTEPEAKLERLYRFCQEQIRNFDWHAYDDLTEQKAKRDKMEDGQTAAKTLAVRCGYRSDIHTLFAGLARAVGFEARFALSADRGELLSIRGTTGWMLADRQSVAIRLGDRWRLYRPGDACVPAGWLDTSDEGAMVYICDAKEGGFDTAQVAAAEETVSRRQGRFELDAEGGLQGEVEITFTGHRAIELRRRWWELSSEDIRDRIRNPVTTRLPSAELSDIEWSEIRTSSEPLVLRYRINVPAYCENVGTRLALVPNVFEANAAELFTAETRRYPIFLDYAETVNDDITLVLPEGYLLDGGTAPLPVKGAGERFVADYQLSYVPKSRTLSYRRTAVLGRDHAIQFRAESYSALKQIFSRIYQSDTHKLMIKPKDGLAQPVATTPIGNS